MVWVATLPQSPMEDVDAVVIGAGVVGLAVARALAQAGREVLILEAEHAFGTGTSSRNSEVIHAGIYYPTGSLRARLCVRGKQLLYDFCASHGVAHQRCGKLIVAATADELPALDRLLATAHANGVPDLQRLTAAEAQALEPALHCVGALLSPSTGIIDSHGLMLALLGDAEAAGAMLALCAPVLAGAARRKASSWTWAVMNRCSCAPAPWSTAPACRRRRCAAAIRRGCGLTAAHIPCDHLAKGCYFTLPGRAPFSRLVYPAPGQSSHLGVHLTLDLGGQARFGPSFEWIVDAIDYTVDPAGADHFYAEVRTLLARPARRRSATGLCRHPAQDQRPGRAGGRFPHRRPGRARRAGAGQPVRHRIAGAHVQPGDGRPCPCQPGARCLIR
jgi:L-2-hydroxyglutarate oxidase LhgO